MLQPVRIGCVWAADRDGDAGADLKVLQQFTACLLEAAPSEEEPTPKASRREQRDQHSECGRPGAWGLGQRRKGRAPRWAGAGGPGPQAGDSLGKRISSSEVQQVRARAHGAPVPSLMPTAADEVARELSPLR